MPHRLRLLLLPLLAGLTLLLTAPATSQPVVFTHGVASGDVTPASAVLWTRLDQEADLAVRVSTSPLFPPASTQLFAAHASPDDDFTAKVLAAPLLPGRTYFYRWHHGRSPSEAGSFRTPPLPSAERSLRFAFTGDSDGTLVDGQPPFNSFESLDAARAERLDFWVYLGDTIYSDSSHRPGGPADTLEEYRDAYKWNRSYEALRDLMAATSTYAMWDDHEVRNDYDGQTVEAETPGRYGMGREAFLEYMPMGAGPLHDPTCAGDPLFRVFHWGALADLIVPDERSCRSADAEDACLLPIGLPDLVPTAPPALRQALRNVLPAALRDLILPLSPPAGCLDAINDPSRTMLGAVQKEAFKQALLSSDARFKFIVNELPIQQFYALSYDRWEGYAAERAELLDFIRDEDIDNVVFLTTDIHANLINEVSIDRFSDPAPIADEFVTGPIATNSFEAEVRSFFGGGLFGDLAVAIIQQLFTVGGVDCRDLDAYSYGVVEVNALTDTATVTLKDDTGAPLHDQLDPSKVCRKTFGP